MESIKKVCRILLVSALIFCYGTTLSYAEERVLPTNHYMAANLRLVATNSSATEATLPNITGPIGVPLIFRTLDQVTCNSGKYEIVLRIVKTEDNTVVASTKPVSFTTTTNGYVYTQPVVWTVLFPAAGWYRFDVVINGQPIVYYYFTVSIAL